VTLFIAAYGLTSALHSDNGKDVDASLIKPTALMLGILKTSTLPYKPNANPAEEMCSVVCC
jgi:hypothetical protein